MRSIVIFLLLVYLTSTCGNHLSYANFAPTNSANSSLKAYVDVGGGVQNPGRYEWFPGMTVVDAINDAGGFTDAAIHSADIFHPDGTREKLIEVTRQYIRERKRKAEEELEGFQRIVGHVR